MGEGDTARDGAGSRALRTRVEDGTMSLWCKHPSENYQVHVQELHDATYYL